MDNNKKKLAVSIVQFLKEQLTTLSSDDAESIEVSMDCIRNVFGVNETDSTLQTNLPLLDIFNRYSSTNTTTESTTTAATNTTNTTSPTPTSPKASPEQLLQQVLSEIPEELHHTFKSYYDILQEKGAFRDLSNYETVLKASKQKFVESKSAEIKAIAEKTKNDGNTKLQSQDYQGALDAYTKAIKYDDTNAIYYANRAACYISLNQADKAIQDCNDSIQRNPKYGKAYARLGSALSMQNKNKEAVEAYQNAVNLEPNNETFKQSLNMAKTTLSTSSDNASGTGSGLPDLSGVDLGGLGSAINGMGGLSGIMENPMFKNIYNNVMQNPEMLNQFLNPEAMKNIQNMMGGMKK